MTGNSTLTGDQPLTQAPWPDHIPYVGAVPYGVAFDLWREAREISNRARPPVWRVWSYLQWRRHYQPRHMFNTLCETVVLTGKEVAAD